MKRQTSSRPRRVLVVGMAAFGVTGADFGNTRKSRELIARTRLDGSGNDGEGGSGPTPAAVAYLASLRNELVQRPAPAAAAAPAVRSRAKLAEDVPHRPAPTPPAASSVGGGLPLQRGEKRFLSAAERRKEKKRKLGSASSSEAERAAPAAPAGPTIGAIKKKKKKKQKSEAV